MNHISRFDPSRLNVGAIYRNALINGERNVTSGDVNYDMRLDLCKDINKIISEARTGEMKNKKFYLAFYEKADLMLKRALVRTPRISIYRPYPEANSMVFKSLPEDTYFCWEIPERHHMINELNCPDIYPAERLMKWRRWENMQLEYFGFKKNDEGNWVENPFYEGDINITEHKLPDLHVSLHSN